MNTRIERLEQEKRAIEQRICEDTRRLHEVEQKIERTRKLDVDVEASWGTTTIRVSQHEHSGDCLNIDIENGFIGHQTPGEGYLADKNVRITLWGIELMKVRDAINAFVEQHPQPDE